MTVGHPRPNALSTSLGILAILIWSTSFAFARSIQDQAGPLWGAACIYLLICGGLFVLYIVTVQVGIGFAPDHRQAVGVIVANYLWPGLTMALSVPLLGRRAKWYLVPGVILGMIGVALGVLYGAGLSLHTALANLGAYPTPYVLGTVAALAWALYSNLSRRLAGPGHISGVPVFLLVSGAILALLHLLSAEQPHWTTRTLLELAYAALLPSLLAYSFWEIAMRHGRLSLIVPVSYFTPLLATIVSCYYLSVPMGASLWIACGLVTAGAVLSNRAVREPASAKAISSARNPAPSAQRNATST